MFLCQVTTLCGAARRVRDARFSEGPADPQLAQLGSAMGKKLHFIVEMGVQNAFIRGGPI